MDDLADLKGIGKTLLTKLHKAQIQSVQDLLLHLPKDYEDRRIIHKIADTINGQKQQIEGIIQQVDVNQFGKKHLSCYFSDETGLCKMHLFRFYPNQIKLLKKGQRILCYGQIIRHTQDSQMIEVIHPEWKIIDKDANISGTITPVYSSIEGISSAVLYKFICQLQHKKPFDELLPATLRYEHKLSDINTALDNIHFPDKQSFSSIYQQTLKARYRLALEEILAHHLNAKIARTQSHTTDFPSINPNKSLLETFIKQLPFAPTKAQRRVIDEILYDFTLKKPLSRLLQGDVGSGKTMVAAAVLIQAARNGLQSIIMAPTEILAEQHFKNLSQWLQAFDIEVVFLAQKLTTTQRKKTFETIQSHPDCVIVGTHAVFQDSVSYSNLGLVIIDEQHRFGVEQRLALMAKAQSANNKTPHQLVMTATPIPRTLAMTVYGDLDLSIIDELPPNRKPIQTSVISQDKKEKLIQKLQNHVNNNGQAYWVCPLIETSEALATLQDASSLYETIKGLLPKARIGLVHGKMKAEEKAKAMIAFKAHEIDILVATTVIEVGVDVPNASIMIIDNAERLGLSQLHQLRGRVGRGSKHSYCILLYQAPLSKTARKRLELMRQTQDGFIIAEEDLKLRGPGDIFGKNQTGEIHFKVADLNLHQQLFNEVGAIAQKLIQNHPKNIILIINRWLKKAADYIKA
ncbi:ATP-dependent DNA helicase RecG [Facilibium subflavum]|uniref:ATP-dependent DNA helicase RecG n=1 Tax=Facilibium subflavum TaxID=2219058 RepID=UPI000E64C186|nr:ATP-dependent DNA helicase RecG [Facilibium subflavum]